MLLIVLVLVTYLSCILFVQFSFDGYWRTYSTHTVVHTQDSRMFSSLEYNADQLIIGNWCQCPAFM